MALLNSNQIQHVLEGDSQLRAAVVQHEMYVGNYGWDQIALARYDGLPIPVRGLPVITEYGLILVTPDARGALHYVLPDISDPRGASLLNTIQQKSYTSPDEGFAAFMNSLIDNAKNALPTAANPFGALSSLIPYVIGAIVLNAVIQGAMNRR